MENLMKKNCLFLYISRGRKKIDVIFFIGSCLLIMLFLYVFWMFISIVDMCGYVYILEVYFMSMCGIGLGVCLGVVRIGCMIILFVVMVSKVM